MKINIENYYEENIENEEKSLDYWMSYSDMMAGLIMMFTLLLLLLLAIYSDEIQHKIHEYHLSKEKNDIIMQENEQIRKDFKLSQEKIDNIIGIKKQIIEDIIHKFSDTGMEITIDKETGAITFSGNILFEYNSYRISNEGKRMLNEFIPVYISILLSEENRDNISEIIIEGHTDDEGGYLYNLELSQKRAFEVVKYILSKEFPDYEYKELLRDFITSNGRSFCKLIYDGAEVDAAKSRRVEFKFRLKEEEMIKEMESILKGVGYN